MSLYLLMMAAIMSVPPVLPLDEKATPIPPPQNEAPMTDTCRHLLNNRQKEGQSEYSKDRFDTELQP